MLNEHPDCLIFDISSTLVAFLFKGIKGTAITNYTGNVSPSLYFILLDLEDIIFIISLNILTHVDD